ncbi:MAG: hypothetical protein HY854_25870 [Burkholderiales bacterium]|nr:hypothetical protein [Burkholderiales bacterium]
MNEQRVGVLLPTFNRPDLLRACVLQLAAQSRPPDLICVHQNGHPDSYVWSVTDLRIAPRIDWIHTPGELPQHQWYAIPLRHLLQQGCTHFFWTDHDDLYLTTHIEAGLAELREHDFSVARHCALLFTKASDWRYNKDVAFTSHAPGGMSSTMCFNRAFATELLDDLVKDSQHHYSDNVVAHVTMPKFRCLVSDTRRTTVYHSHEGSVTSKGWLEAAFR